MFYIVYIQEAHPSDLWQMPVNVADEVVFSSPQNAGERLDLATACVRKLGIELPALLDHMDDSAERDYSGWPDRLYVIDSQGRVAYKSRPGPFGFKPDEMEEALVQVLAREDTRTTTSRGSAENSG
jgi:hypothetical protein